MTFPELSRITVEKKIIKKSLCNFQTQFSKFNFFFKRIFQKPEMRILSGCLPMYKLQNPFPNE
jgi:hypothetical protein